MSFKIFLLLLLSVYNSVCESDLCNYNTCGDCISNVNCVWCSADEMVGDTSRCKPLSVLGTKGKWCHKDFIENPQLENKVVINKSFDEKIDGVQVQLRPQRIKIKARPGVIVPITISYQPAKDFPLDVYYLMDISYTMRNHKEALSKQALEIYTQLTKYTNNVKLGIGSFVEKPGYPYVDQVQQPPHISHAFKNHLSLTRNMTAFTTTVEDINFGANYDDPEAGLDALMQVMTCEKDLGWRPGARRIIVLCTDSTYHSAGDGKVLGVIRPNDMKCHLENNLYNDTMALTYDYPSVSQINKVAKEGHFRVIFAAPASVATDYIKLAKHIMGAKHAFLEDESGTVTIIKDAYKESTQLMRIYKSLPPYIQLTLDQNCDTKQTRNCESTVEQKTVTVEGNLTIQYCPPDHDLKKELTIEVIGINDKVTIELDIDCKCGCEKESGVQNISAKCFNAGVTQCGICKCNPGRYGDDCRCNGTSTSTTDIEKCKLPDDKNVCSGKAQCICGKCDKCEKGFSGDVCQYNDDACPNKCTGRGICTLGKCQCDASWFGEDCSCSLKTDTCIAPYSKEICSGNGECKCGRCICNSEGGKSATNYTGMFCDACDDCAEKRCKELEKFVVCAVMNSTSDCVKQYNAKDVLVVFVNKKDLTYGHDWYMGNKCKTQLENDSYVIFKYQYEDLNIKLGIQDEVELPPKANVFIAVASAIGIVLLIGIVTLIVWKILVDLHDKKEYERFAKESKAQGFDVSSNPLYSPPNVCIANPAFEH